VDRFVSADVREDRAVGGIDETGRSHAALVELGFELLERVRELQYCDIALGKIDGER